MADRIDKAMKGRRSLESALAELEGKYQMRPSAELARMIAAAESEWFEAEAELERLAQA